MHARTPVPFFVLICSIMLCGAIACVEDYGHTQDCIDSGESQMPGVFVTASGDTISGFPDTACVRILPDGDTVVVFEIR